MKKLNLFDHKNFKRKTLYTFMLLAFATPYAQADNHVWTGNVDNDFYNDNNWQLVTDNDDYLVINTPNNNVNPELVINDFQSPLSGALQIGNAAGESGKLSIIKDDNIYARYNAYNVQVGFNGGVGELTIQHTESLSSDASNQKIVEVGGFFNIGEGANSVGIVNLLSSGKAATHQMSEGSTVSGHGIKLNVGLDGGKGTLNIDGGSIGNGAGETNIGKGLNSVGEVNILGGGKLVNGALVGSGNEPASIGSDGGLGTLNIKGTSTAGDSSRAFFGHGLLVGAGVGSNGVVNIGTDGLLSTYGNTDVNNGPIELVGVGVDGGKGVVNVNGQNAIWQVAGYPDGSMTGGDEHIGHLYLGESGQGVVTLSNGGLLTLGIVQPFDNYDPIGGNSYYDYSQFIHGVGTLFLGNQSNGDGTLNIGAGQGQAAQGAGVLKAKEVVFGDGVGTLVFNHTDVSGGYVFDVPLNGGNVNSHVVQVAGKTTLGAAQNQYAGNVNVKGGVLAIDGEMLNGNTTTVTGGALHVNNHLSMVNTSIQGGELVVAGQMDNSGVTSVTGGRLTIDGTSNFNSYSMGGGAVVVNGDMTVSTATQVTNGLITINGTSSSNSYSMSGGTAIVNGDMAVGATAQITGGLVTINNVMHAIETKLHGGMIDVNALGHLDSHVDIRNKGVLAGQGRVGIAEVNTGGIVSPGAGQGKSFGALTFDDLTFGAGSVYRANVNADGKSDLISVTAAHGGSGAAQIDGGTVDVIASAGQWAEKTKYTILNAENGVVGQFTGTTTNLAFLEPNLEKDANNVYLYLERNSVEFEDVGMTPNERNTGLIIGWLNPEHPVYKATLGMSVMQARAAYDNLSGEIHGSLQGAMLNNTRHPRVAIGNHLNGFNGQSPEVHQSLWIDAWGHKGKFKDDGNAGELENKGVGFLVGYDFYQNENTTVGVAAGYEKNDLDIKDIRRSSADVNAIHLLTYARTSLGPVDLQGGIGYSWLDIDTKRDVTIPTLAGKNEASYNGGLVQAFVEASHTFELNEAYRIAPYAGLEFQHIKTNSFVEKGGATALYGKSNSNHMASTVLGVRGGWSVAKQTELKADLGWRHNLNGITPEVKLGFFGGQDVEIRGVKSNANSAIAGLKVEHAIRPDMKIAAGYEGEYGNRSHDHKLNLVWSLQF